MDPTSTRPPAGGADWTTKRKSPNGEGRLWDIQFIDVNTCVVVGSDGLLLKTTDAGATWIEVESRTGRRLHAFAYVNADNRSARTKIGGREFDVSSIYARNRETGNVCL